MYFFCLMISCEALTRMNTVFSLLRCCQCGVWRVIAHNTTLFSFMQFVQWRHPHSPLLPQVLMGKARHLYRRVVTSNGYLGNQQQASFRVLDRRMLLYPMIFILCWGPGSSSCLWITMVTERPRLTWRLLYMWIRVCVRLLSGESGVSAGGETVCSSGWSRGRPLHITGDQYDLWSWSLN